MFKKDTQGEINYAGIEKLYRGQQQIYEKVIQSCHAFAWEKVDNFTLKKTNEFLEKKQERVYFRSISVGKEYPKELRKNHKKLPFLADRMKFGKVEKLVPNLKDKKTCAFYIKSLNHVLKTCLKIKKKVHLVISFEQSHLMNPCTMLNNRLRTAGNKEFKKKIF